MTIFFLLLIFLILVFLTKLKNLDSFMFSNNNCQSVKIFLSPVNASYLLYCPLFIIIVHCAPLIIFYSYVYMYNILLNQEMPSHELLN